MNINKCSVCERVEPLGIDDRCKDCLEDNKKDYNKIEKRIEEIKEAQEEQKLGCSRDKDRYLTGRIGALKQVLED
ncbi:MAG: hypothetical protein KKB59_19415 [Spirochaetes bacterium]|nr:hypothetical protein [Spirochaetota bacterium]